MPETQLQTALNLAALGYPVFPVGTDKKPLTAHGLLDATTDASQIESWWARWPAALVAIRTDGLVVIDRDGDEGRKWPGDAERDRDLASAPTQRTPRGGLHHVFRQPAGKSYRNSASKLAPN